MNSQSKRLTTLLLHKRTLLFPRLQGASPPVRSTPWLMVAPAKHPFRLLKRVPRPGNLTFAGDSPIKADPFQGASPTSDFLGGEAPPPPTPGHGPTTEDNIPFGNGRPPPQRFFEGAKPPPPSWSEMFDHPPDLRGEAP
ncbi:hypothetical protein RRG08_000228 [Elysia crispata]|uniref:Uncharacterized protein n=1 Tax=Elysia crispata TaxID=231223 RepID=A0AAE1AX62_9GAST|nr:hypothetical protein RRG08_000228 [Elysia crispata]